MLNAGRHEGDPRHPRYADYLRIRGEITYEAAYLDERAYQVTAAHLVAGVIPKRKVPLGIRLRQLESVAKAHPNVSHLPVMVGRVKAVLAARNDVMHPFALTGGAFRFDRTADNGVGRTYFSVAEVEEVRDGLTAASDVADMIIGHSRSPRVADDPDRARYLELLGRVHVESDWLFTGLIDVLRNLGNHDERELRLHGVDALRGLLRELILSWPRENEPLKNLYRQTAEVNSLRNRIVHARPMEGHAYKLVSPESGYFDVANWEDLLLLAVVLKQVWLLADNVVKDNAKNGGFSSRPMRAD
jgi:hypothetical protein